MPLAFPTISEGGGSGGGSTYPQKRKGYKAPDVHQLMKEWGIPWGGVVYGKSSGGRYGGYQMSFPPGLLPLVDVYSPASSGSASSGSASSGGGSSSGALAFALVAVSPVLIAYLLGRR